jgi:hypothetical protein
LHDKPLEQEGELVMSDNTAIQMLIHQFFEALNGNDTSELPVTDQIEYLGMMLTEPIRGRAAVTNHLDEISPFIASIRGGEAVISNDAAAVVAQFEGINGVSFDGSYFFRFEGSRFSRIQAIFDTRPLLKGRVV